MKSFLKKLNGEKKSRFWALIEKFGEKIVNSYDKYEAELDEVAEKAADYSGYSYARVILFDDGSIQVDRLSSEADVNDVAKELVEAIGGSCVFNGIVVDDRRKRAKHREDVEFFRKLTEADTLDDFESLAGAYPEMMDDNDVLEYVEIVKDGIRICDRYHKKVE